MSEFEGTHKIQQGTERNFGLVFAGVFFLVAVFPVLIGNGGIRFWALLIACIFCALAFLAPKALKTPNLLWFKFGLLLGRYISPIILALVFFVTITPTGIVMRIFGKDLLRLKMQPDAKSYWIDRNKEDNPMGSMKNQF